jgi:hypothetical protein
MPITSSNPTIKDGEEYPYFGINLAISPLWTNPSYVGGSVAMQLTPYRMDANNQVDKLSEEAKALVYFNVFEENDPALLEAVTTIMGALQKFVIDKQL